MTYDVAILGAGPGGYVAAIRGGQLGAKVCLIDEGELGGTCLNRGCIPSKAFYESAGRMESLRRGAEFGIRAELGAFDLAACVGRKDKVVGDLVGGIQKLLKGHGVDVLRGRGTLMAPDSIQVTGLDGGKTVVTARAVIIATGSRPADLTGLPVDGRRIVNSDQIWGLTDLPERMVIVGGGVIGCEMAHIYSAFGAKVTVLELLDRILATEEREVSRTVQKTLEARGVEFRTGVRVQGAEAGASGVTIALQGGEVLRCDRAVVAVGRAYNSKGLGLEKAGIELDGKGRVVVNDEMETAVPGVYAVGDVVGQLMLAHVATSEALVAMHNALGKKYWMDYSVVPYAVFTAPEVASVGAKEAELKQKKIDYKVGRFSFAASGKALCMGEPEGFIKILSDSDTGRILGATVVGAHSSDIIGEVALAMRMEASPGDIVTTIHVHPTMSEVILEASEDTMGLSIHKMGRRSAKEE
ncbi:MAG: dihydrolipoyl dehydrogenase [Deltaproteobacteria bacterium]|nr:dihydrolipoyl dehydrogenase [Deltaproteobacteria bacterium]